MLFKKITGVIVAAGSAYLASFAAAELIASKGNCTEEPDFLLILGCRVRGDKPELTLQTRIDAAADYLNIHKNVTVVCCGGVVHDDQTKSEAQTIADGLIEKGIEPERIILEDESRTTAQNFANAKAIIDNMNLGTEPRLAFLSSEYHLLRAGIIGKIAGVSAKSVPASSPKERRLKNYYREFSVFVPTLIETMKVKK